MKRPICVGVAALICVLAMLCGTLVWAAEKPYTLVLDAGHGGFDGGAIGAAGTDEQDINLSIATCVNDLCGFFGIQTVMTRTDAQALEYDSSRTVRENKVRDIQAREQICLNTARAVFISIHLNQFQDSRYSGAQVFFSPNHAKSKALAEAIQTALVSGVDPQNHRIATQADSSIYLMKKLSCPAVIVECGFLSNPREERLLANINYHKRLALCVLVGFMHSGLLSEDV